VKTCDLKEIIYLPSGIFENTSIKTCIFYFIKKREGTDVIEPIAKISKTQKELRRDYKFSKTHQTKSVKFYDCNPYKKNVKNLLVDVPVEKLAANSYSLNYAEYMKDEAAEAIEYEEGVVLKTLGEVCEFQNGSQLDKKDMVDGNIPIFGGGFKIVGFHNANNRNGNETIVCGTGAYSGYVNHNYGNPFWASQCFTMKSKNINIMIDKYLYSIHNILKEREDHLVLYYNDLIMDPLKEIKKIYKFLNVPAENILIDNFNQFKVNNISYDDSVYSVDYHKIRTDKIKKINREIEQILPKEIISLYSNRDIL
jgi:type I restriction-modification system DNA methylase subunit